MTDANGQEVWQWAISGFGEVEATTAQTGWIRARNGSAGQISNTLPVTFNLRFPGQQFDEETGLHYNHHRYYDPYLTVGYTEADPLGLSAGWNRFVYVDGGPLDSIDPEGLLADSVTATCRKDPIFCAELELPKPPIPAPIPIINPHDRSWRTPDTWHVYVSCHVKKEPICENCPDFIGGHAFGGTFTEANARAQSDANANLSLQQARGCQARHCQAVACYVRGKKVECPRPR